MLLTIGVSSHPFYIAPVAQGHHHLLLRDKVFIAEIPYLLTANLGAPGIAVPGFQLIDLLLDQKVDLLGVGQKVLQVGDSLKQLSVFIGDLLALQGSQPA